jgi:hypothetical protein
VKHTHHRPVPLEVFPGGHRLPAHRELLVDLIRLLLHGGRELLHLVADLVVPVDAARSAPQIVSQLDCLHLALAPRLLGLALGVVLDLKLRVPPAGGEDRGFRRLASGETKLAYKSGERIAAGL